MSKIVGACVSQFHDDENEFELLLAFEDGREFGHSVSRKVAQDIASELIGVAGDEPDMTEITKEAIEAAGEITELLRDYDNGSTAMKLTKLTVALQLSWPKISAALSTLPIAGDAIETAILKERLRAATVARKAAREALEKGFLNRIPDRVFDAVHEASSFPPNLDAADARSSTLEQKLKVATEALENIQQTRCDHDMGFDREIGPLGCSLGEKCVCVGLCTIASRALQETSGLVAVLPTDTTSTDALKNALGLLDTPVGRRRHKGDSFYSEVVAYLRSALAKSPSSDRAASEGNADV